MTITKTMMIVMIEESDATDTTTATIGVGEAAGDAEISTMMTPKVGGVCLAADVTATKIEMIVQDFLVIAVTATTTMIEMIIGVVAIEAEEIAIAIGD